MTYAFTFDAAFCSGCKACQAACKDKNNLPLGVLWRRVIEVSGGAWQRKGEAWTNTVFAYNVSVACNHCLHPKCAGVCPTGAYEVREDGIVLLDTSKCMGCGYCAWACPYGAPQYNPEAGTMTKCNFCFDNLEQGLPPACVAACPLRVLDYGEVEVVPAAKGLRLWEVPAETHPYAAMNTSEEKFVANVEEIRPRPPSIWRELPLILFTLLTQLAVGGFWATLWTFPRVWTAGEQEFTLQLLIGFCLGAALLASLAHLGTKKNAWRAIANWRKSWLSREALFAGLFGIGWLFTTLQRVIWQRSVVEWMAVTATLGLGLIYSMSRVYRLPAVPAWNTWRTNAVFMVSTLLLGQSLMAAWLPQRSSLIGGAILLLLFLQLLLMRNQSPRDPLDPIRVVLVLAAMLLNIISLSLPGTWVSLLIFLMVLAEEGMGRWSFYRAAQNLFSLA